MVEHKVAIGDIPKEERDELDKIDDKFDLYDEDNHEKKLDFKEVVAQEKAKIKGFKIVSQILKRVFSPLSLLLDSLHISF